MTRTLPALVALAAAAAALTAVPSAPAQADGGTYADTTTITFRDAAGDAPAAVDLRRGDVTLDPNLPSLDVFTRFGSRSSDPSFVVLRLGEEVSGSCEIRVELVSNRGFDSLVREPGETTLPAEYTPGDDQDYASADDPRLDLVPTCAVLDLIDPDGTVLDTVAGVVTNTPAGRGALRVSHEPAAILNVDSGEAASLVYRIRSAGGPVYDAAVDLEAGDPGLVLGNTHADLGDLGGPDQPDTAADRRVRFTATPGPHTLTLRLSGGNAATSEVAVTIWGRGGPSLTGGDSLAGRTFFVQDDDSLPSRDSWREWTAYSFVDDAWVRRSYRDTRYPTPPEQYEPCTTKTCTRYAYDATTGALQVGTDRGEVDGRVLRLNEVYDHAARAARAASTVAFVGRNVGPWNLRLAEFRLTLRKDGTFTRASRLYYFDRHPSIQRGRYRVGNHGVLIARTSKGKVVRTGLAFVLDARGRPAPQRLGVYAFDVWFHPEVGR